MSNKHMAVSFEENKIGHCKRDCVEKKESICTFILASSLRIVV